MVRARRAPPANTGGPLGCADECSLCVNALENYLAACESNVTALSYGALEGYTSLLNSSLDCYDFFSVAARPYAAAACGDAFDHIIQYVQSAANSAVVVAANGTMTTPYSCLQADSISCPAECNSDLALLAAACHGDDVVRWDGNGLPGYLTVTGAPANTFVTPLQAFQLFLNGTAGSGALQPGAWREERHAAAAEPDALPNVLAAAGAAAATHRSASVHARHMESNGVGHH